MRYYRGLHHKSRFVPCCRLRAQPTLVRRWVRCITQILTSSLVFCPFQSRGPRSPSYRTRSRPCGAAEACPSYHVMPHNMGFWSRNTRFQQVIPWLTVDRAGVGTLDGGTHRQLLHRQIPPVRRNAIVTIKRPPFLTCAYSVSSDKSYNRAVLAWCQDGMRSNQSVQCTRQGAIGIAYRDSAPDRNTRKSKRLYKTAKAICQTQGLNTAPPLVTG